MEYLVDPRTGRRIFKFCPTPDRSNEVFDAYLFDPNNPAYGGPYNLYETATVDDSLGSLCRNFMKTHPPLYVIDRYGRELILPIELKFVLLIDEL